jgi:hypothetical protein
MHVGFWWGSVRERDQLDSLHIGGGDIKMDLKKYRMREGAGLIWLRVRTRSCEHGNEPSGFVKCKEFEFLNN